MKNHAMQEPCKNYERTLLKELCSSQAEPFELSFLPLVWVHQQKCACTWIVEYRTQEAL